MPLEFITETEWTDLLRHPVSAWLLVFAATAVLYVFSCALTYVLDAIEDRFARRRAVQAAGLARDRRRLDAAINVVPFNGRRQP